MAPVTDPDRLTHTEVEEGKALCGTVSTEHSSTLTTVMLWMKMRDMGREQ